MNHIKEIARMLGVRIGERFNIIPATKNFDNTYFFGDNDLYQEHGDNFSSNAITYIVLSGLISGKYEILKIKPPHTGLENVGECDIVFLLDNTEYVSAVDRLLRAHEFSNPDVRDDWVRMLDIKKRLAKAASKLNDGLISKQDGSALWCIIYAGEDDKVHVCKEDGCFDDAIYFLTDEAAVKAIEMVGEDDLIWLLRDFQPYIGYAKGGRYDG